MICHVNNDLLSSVASLPSGSRVEYNCVNLQTIGSVCEYKQNRAHRQISNISSTHGALETMLLHELIPL